MLDLLKKHFGYDEFRPLQEEIVQHILSGKDALVLMPTGGGKSLCFQLPALQLPGLTLVVSPLIALMKDQVDGLQANGIKAAFLNSALNASEMAAVENDVRRGNVKLLYVAPERLAVPAFVDVLRTLQVSLIAVDEAHCISEWGHDFRPEYRTLRLLREQFPKAPVVALTATATERVRRDIIAQLHLDKGRIFLSSFNRPNLSYVVRQKRNSFASLLRLLARHRDRAALIYCFSRKDTENLARNLVAQGFQALPYHAGLDAATRKQTQDKFIRDEVPIIVATIAFGMGIDKPDVRLVVHMDLPKSVEGYYQETGRAGRDGLPSECVLFFSWGDKFKQEYFIQQMSDAREQVQAREKLRQMLEYGQSRSCRRKYLLTYFHENWPHEKCEACDVCVPVEEEEFEVEVTRRETRAIKNARLAAVEVDQALFEQLRALRKKLADARRVPPFVIFGDRALLEMARLFPQSQAAFSNISGVGRAKLAEFGPDFVRLIAAYAKEHGLVEDSSLACERFRQPRVTDTLEETRRLVVEKQSLHDVAKERSLSVTTIISHLEKLAAMGQALDLTHLPLPLERRKIIEAAFQALGTAALAPVRERLGESFSYDELRVVRLMMES